MKTYRFNNSQSLFTRAAKVIPCGIYGHLSPAPLVPPTAYPFYAVRAKGSRFCDVDGNEFIDYMCAYGPMIVGYNHEEVDAAAMKQYEAANCVTAPTPVMVELAEYLVDLIPIADWAFFAKNGGDVTSYALMVARAATGRKKILMVSGGYHGVAPWAQVPGHHGVMDDDYKNCIRVKWNDYAAFERAVNENPGEIAGFIATPYHHPTFADNELPAKGYWQKIEAVCRKEGIVLIVDDVRCGFRLDMRGSHEYFGFKPDLICFCKAIGNGYPISALVGTDSLKSIVSRIFYTGSYWFSAAPMAAAITTLKELKRINGPKLIRETGEKLLGGLVEIAKGYGYDLKVTGHPSMPYLRITNDESVMLHQDWCGECTKRGAYFVSHHNWFISTAHTDEDIQKTWDIADDAFKAVKNSRGV
ncbi:MAG: aminotransferase class III-fold pyridoxal phosphate-dependent enzyme [Deltaproteobacteria bacterium]|nr:MAG: aminotransferase class III-fold pyridoxal phosphate-dependent enzyme [Deltaproteobacteria bacterium]